MYKLVSTFLLLVLSFAVVAQPLTFSKSKKLLRKEVYHDQIKVGEFYCGCQWRWVGSSGGRIDFNSCGYRTRAQPTRAARIEWEHVVPAHNFGNARQCWQKGGRKNCQKTDPLFNEMEADMHNLVPSVGEINADRSNYRYRVLKGTPLQHGKCEFRVDFKRRAVEPRDAVKGQAARIYFYMHDRYKLKMSSSQRKLFTAWNKQYPVSQWELERDRRIQKIIGHSNPFIQERLALNNNAPIDESDSSIMGSVKNVWYWLIENDTVSNLFKSIKLL